MPSSFAIGWSPVVEVDDREPPRARARRRRRRDTPSESGPRCTSVALIAASRSGSARAGPSAIPQIPHMRRILCVPQRGVRHSQELWQLAGAARVGHGRAPLLAVRLRIPYPILLVLGGLALGFVPGRAGPRAAAGASCWSASCRRCSIVGVLHVAARAAQRTCGRSRCSRSASSSRRWSRVAVVAHDVIDDISWAAAFVLGAVVSPTDPLAATAIGRRLGVPRRLVRSSRARASSTTAPRSCSTGSPSSPSSPARSRSRTRPALRLERRRRHRDRARRRLRDPRWCGAGSTTRRSR